MSSPETPIELNQMMIDIDNNNTVKNSAIITNANKESLEQVFVPPITNKNIITERNTASTTQLSHVKKISNNQMKENSTILADLNIDGSITLPYNFQIPNTFGDISASMHSVYYC